MQVDDLRADANNPHKVQGNPSVKCNSLNKTSESFNCYLTPAEAIALARNLLQKAQLIVELDLVDGVVHLWNVGASNEKLSCGLNKKRVGPKRKKKPTAK